MKDIPDNSIDMILTDPPWNTTDYEFEEVIDIDFYNQCKRVLKNNGWFFCIAPITLLSTILNFGFRLKFEYIWVKPSIIPSTYNTKRPNTQHEIIGCFIKNELKKMSELYLDKDSLKTTGLPYKREIKSSDKVGHLQSTNRRLPTDKNGKKYDIIITNIGTRSPSTVIFYPNKNKLKFIERSEHPTQKPVNMLELFVRGYCHENGLVLDPFAGSGTTAIACINTNRNYICIEKEPKYFEIMKNRITDATERD